MSLGVSRYSSTVLSPPSNSNSNHSSRPSHAVSSVEKHRPREIKDVVGNHEGVSRREIIGREGNLPNIIISGPPGTGKTTSILCLAHALLGPAVKDAVLELNASDERGIDVVREKIKMFAKKKVTLPPGRHKLVLLDEADNMTSAAQQALRRIMEIYSDSTRFALACNISSKIIEPIQSRCAILRFGRLADEQILKRLKEVLAKEEVAYDASGLEALIFTADGDMRQALNNAQSTAAGFGFISNTHVYKVCDQPHPVAVQRILELCANGKNAEAQDRFATVVAEGFSPIDIVTTFFRVVKNHNEFGEAIQLEFIKIIGMAQMSVLNGTDSYLQLSAMVARLARVGIFMKQQRR